MEKWCIIIQHEKWCIIIQHGKMVHYNPAWKNGAL
jgi:hypothetical protein